jgi:uncharacterized DUF497 family protein
MGYFRVGLLEFEWDDEKAASNLVKHGVSFAEAATIFRDRLGILRSDQAHSNEEERFLLIGVSERRKIIIVVYVMRRDRYRIVSARPATPKERRNYARSIE